MWVMKRMTISGVPSNLARSSSSWVATPTGQVFLWQTRAMMQPSAIMALVPKLTSSAPSMAAITTSRPLARPPSVRRVTRVRRPLANRVWWISARPISQGRPAFLTLLRGLAPVPPLAPLRWITSAKPLTTPAATVPTPISATSLTLTLALGLMVLRSKISWARSSML